MKLNCKDRCITNQVTSFPWEPWFRITIDTTEGVQWYNPQDQKYQNPNLQSSLSPYP